MAQLTLLIMSLLVIVTLVAHGRTRKNGFNILDAYFLMVMLYFGVYSLGDVLLNKAADKDPVVIVQTFIFILASMMVTWVLYLMIPLRLKRALRFDHLVEQWANVNRKIVIILAIIVVSFAVYIYLEFGILSSFSGEELELLGIFVPTWVAPVKSLIVAIGFSICIFFIASIIKGRLKFLSLYGVIFLLMISIISLEGRRAIFEIILVGYIMWSCEKGRLVYSFKSVPYVFILTIFLVLFSNIYQTYRMEIFSTTARVKGIESTSLISAAANFNATIENLSMRTAVWQFNYMINAEQAENPSKIFYGTLGWQAFLNSIPRLFWSEKEVHDIDELISIFYDFEVTDQSTNNFATFQADFGVIMIAMLPLTIILVLLLVSYFQIVFSKNRTLFLIVSTLCLQYLIKIETSYGAIVILLRHILLLVVIWLIIILLQHGFKYTCAFRRAPKSRGGGMTALVYTYYVSN